MTKYEKLYKYCTRAKVHGAVYKERLKRLQQMTITLLRKEKKDVKRN